MVAATKCHVRASVLRHKSDFHCSPSLMRHKLLPIRARLFRYLSRHFHPTFQRSPYKRNHRDELNYGATQTKT